MHLKVKCVKKTCPDYDREQLIEVGRLASLIDETARNVSCPSCRSLMKIPLPVPSRRGKKRPSAL